MFMLELILSLPLIIVLSYFDMKTLPEPADTIVNIVFCLTTLTLVVSPFLGWWDEITKDVKDFLKTDC
jgi:hypothetical protein